MTKKSALRLSQPPIEIGDALEPKETPKERLAKLEGYLAVEKASANPCAAYIDDLRLSIFRLKNSGSDKGFTYAS